MSNLNSTSDTFTLSIRRSCSDSALTVSVDISDVPYEIDSGNSAAISSTFTDTKATDDYATSCFPDQFLHFWDSSTMSWVDFATFNPAWSTWTDNSGVMELVINTNDFASYDGKQFLMRITTKNTITSIEDQFTITLVDPCRTSSDSIVLNSFTKNTFTFNVPASSPIAMVINPIDITDATVGFPTISVSGGCEITCLMQKLDIATGVWSDYDPSSDGLGTLDTTGTLAANDVCDFSVSFDRTSTLWTNVSPR
jgi:hypothetical protein